MRARPSPGWLAAAILAAAAAVASSDDVAERFYQTRLVKVSRAAAMRLWDAAEHARKESLFRFARDEARRVLELDPDNARARAFFGYVKKGDAWEIDSNLSTKVPTENAAPPGTQKLADAENAWRASAAKADLDVAAMYAALGDECTAKGFRSQAEAAYGKTLALDRDNAAAHRGLGHVKFGDGLWITADANRVFESSRTAHPVAEGSRYDEIFGEKFLKAESAHFRVESPFPQEAIATYLESCERAYTVYLADLGLDPAAKVLPATPLFCVVGTEGQWDRWINRLTSSDPGFYRSRSCHWARDRWACAVATREDMTDVKRRDRLAHESAHMLSLALWTMPDGCWLDEALAHRTTVLALGTTAAYCLAPHKEDYARAGAELAWTDQSQWKSLLREVVAKNDDLPLRKIVSKSAYELPLYASIKAWSVVDLLIRRDRAAFVGMLKEVKSETNLVTLLENRFGKDVEALDDEWRKWVMETY